MRSASYVPWDLQAAARFRETGLFLERTGKAGFIARSTERQKLATGGKIFPMIEPEDELSRRFRFVMN
jgi:hypothetical protein